MSLFVILTFVAACAALATGIVISLLWHNHVTNLKRSSRSTIRHLNGAIDYVCHRSNRDKDAVAWLEGWRCGDAEETDQLRRWLDEHD